MWAKQKGFTIVELLIVIVVIGILAAISLTAYNGVQTKAKVNTAKSDLTTLNKAIQAGRVSQGKTLYGITGSNCTSCGVIPYNTALDLISAASGISLNGLKKGDPWGNPYQIDENEGEGGSCANQDALFVSGQPTIPTVLVPFYSC